MTSWLRSALSIAGFFCLWEIVARSGVVPAEYFPAPVVIAQTIAEEMARGELPRAFVVTFARAILGAGAGVAIALGVALASVTDFSYNHTGFFWATASASRTIHLSCQLLIMFFRSTSENGAGFVPNPIAAIHFGTNSLALTSGLRFM